MDITPNIKLPYIMATQAQKHVSHNEAIRALDAVVQLSVKGRDLTASPGSLSDGDRYIVGASATGEWVGKDGNVAAWQDNAWMFYQPVEGWLCWVADEDKLLAFDGSVWSEVSSGGGSTNPTLLVGVNTTASDPNKLAVKSDAVLFSHDDVAPGTGDIRTTLNKATTGNTASFLFQDNWSGRAEIGLTGDDDFHFKVSPNGSVWQEAIQVDRTTGTPFFPNAIRLGTNSAANQLNDYEEGTWMPTLGNIATNNLAGATSLTVAYAYYRKIGSMVFLHCGFDVQGLTTATFTQKSTLKVSGLPFPPLDDGGYIDVGSVSGFVYKSIGSATDSMLGGAALRPIACFYLYFILVI